MESTGCSAVDSGLLTSGLKTAFVSVLLNTRDMISAWNSSVSGISDSDTISIKI